MDKLFYYGGLCNSNLFLFVFQFVLIVGESHLRPFVDGFVPLRWSQMSFGFLAVCGATARDLRTELRQAQLDRQPDAVCVMAPSNDLVAGTIEGVASDFAALLRAAQECCPQVCILTF